MLPNVCSLCLCTNGISPVEAYTQNVKILIPAKAQGTQGKLFKIKPENL